MIYHLLQTSLIYGTKAKAEHFKRHRRRVEVVSGRGLVTNRQWTTWKSARQGWQKSCYGEIVPTHFPLAGLSAALALIVYGLAPLFALLYALYSDDAVGA